MAHAPCHGENSSKGEAGDCITLQMWFFYEMQVLAPIGSPQIWDGSPRAFSAHELQLVFYKLKEFSKP
jgi:hypothetical protein